MKRAVWSYQDKESYNRSWVVTAKGRSLSFNSEPPQTLKLQFRQLEQERNTSPEFKTGNSFLNIKNICNRLPLGFWKPSCEEIFRCKTFSLKSMLWMTGKLQNLTQKIVAKVWFSNVARKIILLVTKKFAIYNFLRAFKSVDRWATPKEEKQNLFF